MSLNPKTLIPKNPTPEEAAALCNKLILVVLENGHVTIRWLRCNRPQVCDFCLGLKATLVRAKLAEILQSDLDRPLYRYDYTWAEADAMRKRKRNLRDKKPDLLVYLPHHDGITLLTTSDYYGGAETSLRFLSHEELKRLVKNLGQKRLRIMTYGQTGQDPDLARFEQELATEESVTIEIDMFLTDAPFQEVKTACQKAEVMVEAFSSGSSRPEKAQAKLNCARAMLEKRGYVTQTIRRKSVFMASYSLTDVFEDFDFATMRQKLRQMSESLT